MGYSNIYILQVCTAGMVWRFKPCIIIIIIISFMQGIHTYIPETNHVSRLYNVAAIIIIIIIIIIIVVVFSFMQGIHIYIPETNHVSRVYSVIAILHILLMVRITLSSPLNSLVLLHEHFPQYVCRAQCSCFR
jgi:cytochrome c biogenesis protein CcdA